MKNRAGGWEGPLVLLLLFMVVMGALSLVERGGAHAPVLFLAALLLGLVLLRRSRRCPTCGCAGMPGRATRGVFECPDCGARFRRVRQGSAAWLDLERPRSKYEAKAPFLRVSRGRLERIPLSPDGRWAWISSFLPRLRALRRQLRPLGDRPAPELNLLKTLPLKVDFMESWGPVEPPMPPTGVTFSPSTLRSFAAKTGLAVVLGAAVASMVPSLLRLRALDDAYYAVVLLAICVCAFVTLVLGRVFKLTSGATLALLTSDLVLKALHLAAIGRLPDPYVLGTMAVVFPMTPLLISPLFRRWRVDEQSKGDFTTGRLLRNKQARVLARASRNLTEARRVG
ncbi:MAG: hypothetical protein P4L84_28030 [Isosphaeraceae bacterium]|nr:hypothetical protein [Isosphaeraceae bacterium]